MKNYIYIFSGVLILSIFCSIFANHTEMKGQKEKLEELKTYLIDINSISPKDTLFDDLSFLKETLKDKDIVMLGEQVHSDASTMLAKARLIKYLHKNLGFDVILFEAGLYDCENLWNRLKTESLTDTIRFSRALFPFWCNYEENQDLMNYIVRHVNSENEIELAGFDVQFSGLINFSERNYLLSTYLDSKVDINPESHVSFFSIKDQYPLYSRWQSKSLSKQKKDSIGGDIKSIINILEKNGSQHRRDSLNLRFFKNLDVLYNYSWNYKWGAAARFHIRDSAMAENFIWQKENKFKNRKVIIWAANLHISYDNSKYEDDMVKFTSMGERIKKEYSNRCYSINFSSFKKDENNSYNIDNYNNKSLEFLMHKVCKDYLFLDFNRVDSSSFLKQGIIMNCNQGLSFKAKWSDITDGVFYIDNMKQLTKQDD